MYFKNFPDIVYEFTIKGKDTAIQIKDITKNVRFRKDVLANITVYDEYDILDGETPEHIAEKIYGNPEYHWIIMLVNEKYDYKADFPLSSDNLENYISDKYGPDIYSIHHYENEKGFVIYFSGDLSKNILTETAYQLISENGYNMFAESVIDLNQPQVLSISNYDFEVALNESKRRIKIVPSYLIEQILTEYKKII